MKIKNKKIQNKNQSNAIQILGLKSRTRQLNLRMYVQRNKNNDNKACIKFLFKNNNE